MPGALLEARGARGAPGGGGAAFPSIPELWDSRGGSEPGLGLCRHIPGFSRCSGGWKSPRLHPLPEERPARSAGSLPGCAPRAPHPAPHPGTNPSTNSLGTVSPDPRGQSQLEGLAGAPSAETPKCWGGFWDTGRRYTLYFTPDLVERREIRDAAGGCGTKPLFPGLSEFLHVRGGTAPGGLGVPTKPRPLQCFCKNCWIFPSSVLDVGSASGLILTFFVVDVLREAQTPLSAQCGSPGVLSPGKLFPLEYPTVIPLPPGWLRGFGGPAVGVPHPGLPLPAEGTGGIVT